MITDISLADCMVDRDYGFVTQAQLFIWTESAYWEAGRRLVLP